MRWIRIALLALIMSFVGVHLSHSGTVYAYNENNPAHISVTLTVPDTSLIIGGWSSPHAFITVKDNGGVAATGTANAAGRFNIILGSRVPGVHAVDIDAIDGEGNTTDSISYTITLTLHTNTSLNLFLPPTINTRTDQKGIFLVYGYTKPNSNLTVIFDSSTIIAAKSDSSGKWEIDPLKSGLKPGKHSVVAQADDYLGSSSYFTNTRTVTVPEQKQLPVASISKPAAFNEPGSAPANLGCDANESCKKRSPLPTASFATKLIADAQSENLVVKAATVFSVVVGTYAVFGTGLLILAKGAGAAGVAGHLSESIVLFKGLLGDPQIGLGSKVVLTIGLAYLLSPLDLFPDFIPVFGKVDDTVITTFILKHLHKRVSEDIIMQHWTGPAEILKKIKNL